MATDLSPEGAVKGVAESAPTASEYIQHHLHHFTSGEQKGIFDLSVINELYSEDPSLKTSPTPGPIPSSATSTTA